MGRATREKAAKRVESAAEQIIEEHDSEAALDALRELLVDLPNAGCPDMSRSFDAAVEAAGDEDALDVAREIIADTAFANMDGGETTELAVEHAPEPEEITPATPADQ